MKKKILIVEDDTSIVNLIELAVETLPVKCTITSVPSGEEAILAVLLDFPDLIIIDLGLPGMSGWDLIQLVRKRSSILSVLIITGRRDEAVLRRSRELGIEACFFKPIVMSVFLKKVKTILSKLSEISQKSESMDAGKMLHNSPEQLLLEKTVLKKGNTISSVVHILYENLGAIAVTIIDHHGEILAEEGEKIDSLLTQGWQDSVTNSLNAAKNFSDLFKHSFEYHFQFFTSSQFTFVILPVDEYGFLVILHHQKDLRKLTTEIQFILDAQDVLSVLGFDEPTPLADVLEKKSEVEKNLKNGGEKVAPVDIDVNALFDDNAVGDEAESFWEEANETAGSEINLEKSGFLNFNQAKQRGLVPEEE
ncbi:MAG: response regulator [Anaerolineaceae bacterium]|nr:response regulator [Anaerolineaceae bacterium]